MYPAGAYVTYEHEYILIFRKGGKREFVGIEKELRQASAYFWEERNLWFSDLWDIKGTTQAIFSSKASRDRNASYPLEVPYRLVCMYSVKGDTVLDPFAGLGTTSIACMMTGRNSISIDIDREIVLLALENMSIPVNTLNSFISARIMRHLNFIDSLPEDKKAKCYRNIPHGFMVKTRQETAICIEQLQSISRKGNTFICQYEKYQPEKRSEQITMLI